MAFHGIMRELEETGCDIADDIKDDLRDSKHGKLKLLGLEALPIVTGAVFGGVGRIVGTPELIAVPPIMSLLFGTMPSHSPRAVGRTLISYAKYAIGAALPYADQIYMAIENFNK